MNWREASEQLAAIHAQLVRSELSPAFRAAPTAATGVLAGALASAQLWIAPPQDEFDFCRQWLGLAAVASAICAGDLLVRFARAARDERRRFQLALAQLIPALLVGLAWTVERLRAEDLRHLPALWSALFGLALWSARPYVPRGMTKVAVFYLLGAGGLFACGSLSLAARAFAMGALFGCGQTASALYLHRFARERASLR